MWSSSFQSSDAQTEEVLLEIDKNARQLKTNDVTYSNQKLLKTRLRIVWGEDSKTQSVPATSTWRRSRARQVYTEIQKASDHLLLPAILAITPTQCTKKAIDNVLSHLLRIENYELFHLNLSQATKKFLETTAVEQGFSGNDGYLNFIHALFPQSEEPRQIQLAYTSIPLDSIDMLFEVMRRGIETSKLWVEERERGDSRSNFGTALIPTGDKDCCFTITVGRKDMMEGLRRLQLTQLKIS